MIASISSFGSVLLVVVIVCALLLTRGLARLLFGWIRKRKEHEVEPVICSGCGYRLEGLELPRCPECGALRGFRVPMDSLGISEAELRDLRQKKRECGAQHDNPESGSA